MFNLHLTLSKEFIGDTLTPTDKGPVLEDLQSLLSKGSLTLV